MDSNALGTGDDEKNVTNLDDSVIEIPNEDAVEKVQDNIDEEMKDDDDDIQLLDIPVKDVTNTETSIIPSGSEVTTSEQQGIPEADDKTKIDSTDVSNNSLQTEIETSPSAGSSKSAVPSFVIPLKSPRMPSLAYRLPAPLKITDKEMKPTPTPAASAAATGDSVFKLLTYSKSISSALAPAKPPPEKRKHMGGCCNMNCTENADELVVASRNAIIYFNLNTLIKKIYKICNHCRDAADKYMAKAVRAAQNGDCILTFKTEPLGMYGDVIELLDGDEEDPAELAEIVKRENEMIDLTENFDSVISSILCSVDTRKQIEKCDNATQLEVNYLERDMVSLESKLSFVERQMMEAKKMYDKITGHNQTVPVILEEIEIEANGEIKRFHGHNPHMNKLADQLKLSEIENRRTRTQKPIIPKVETKVFNNQTRHKDDEGEGEVMEVEPVQRAQETRVTLAPTPKVIPRVMPSVGSIVYALNRTLLHFWLRGEVVEIISMGPSKHPEFIVRFDRGKINRDAAKRDLSQSKQVTSRQIAYNLPCPFILPVGSRILAKFKDELKTEPTGDGQFYAGVIAEPPKNTNNFRYLVFFDDGYAQYVHHTEVLMVYEASKEVWADVHPDSSDFIRNYVQKYPERPMVRLTIGQVITTEWNGKWWVARVVELDCSLVKMKFENDGRFEWIYRGSTRLSPLFEKQNRQKTRQVARRHVSTVTRGRNQPTIEYNYAEGDDDDRKTVKATARKSVSGVPHNHEKTTRMPHYDYGEFEGSIIKKPIPSTAPKTKTYEPHKCNSSCCPSFTEPDKELRKLNPLALPLYLGWSREIAKNPRRMVFYRGPCGRRLRDMEELYAYLLETNCAIPIDHYCFDLAVDCLNEFRHARQHSFLPDLTYGKENTPVQVVNAFDFEYPPYVEYSSSRIAGNGVTLNTEDEFLVGCDCTDDCSDHSKCSCWQLTLSGISFTKLNNDEYPLKGYQNRRLMDHIVSGVYECNPRCKCRKTCMNKVVQNGMKAPLQVFKTAAKGWGIRPLFDIPEGAFICIYAGQVLTEQGANEDGKQFGDEYLAELDYIECNETIKADYESDVSDIEEEDSPEKPRRKKKGRRDNDSDEEFDCHANDSSYRGPAPTTSRTVSTRKKNGNGKPSGSRNDSDDDEDDGTRKRSRFNAEVKSYSKSKKDERLPLRELFGKDEQCYIMDAKTVGNIGRYLNHSCQPNVFVQNVFVDTHDLRYPWVAFFASKHIRAGSELTWDYNYDIGSVPDKVMYCYCGSPECRGRLL